MQHLFITYELAVLAKEKGFDEPCLARIGMNSKSLFWCKGNTITTNSLLDTDPENSLIALPLYQQTVDWFHENGVGIYECFYHPTKKERIYTVKIHTLNQIHGNFTLNKAIEEAFKLI